MVVLARLTTAYAAVPRVASGIRGFDITAGEESPCRLAGLCRVSPRSRWCWRPSKVSAGRRDSSPMVSPCGAGRQLV